LVVLFTLAACSHTPPKPPPLTGAEQAWQRPSQSRVKPAKPRHYGEAFPTPPELEPAVNFWRKTYANWRRSQVVIHDDHYLDVVYEIIDLPGPVGESLSSEQKEWVASRRNDWKNRLAALAMKVSSGAALDGDEQRLAALLRAQQGRALDGAAERVRSQRGMMERFKRGVEISARYEPKFRKIFREAGLPEDLAYLPHVESSFQTGAQSSAGAVGIWQFTRGAAEKFMNINGSVDDRYDPIASTYGAARYLSYAYAKLGDWPTALTSYNHGINGMIRAQSQVGNDFVRIVEQYDSPKFGFASRNYYAEFLAAREIARNPSQYFAEAINDERTSD
jgi:membrane-bound lytic murein transglycosylase D